MAGNHDSTVPGKELSRFLSALTLALALLVSGGAMPQDKDPIGLFNDASDLAEKGQFEEAVAIWLMVADAIPEKYRPVIQVNLGLAYKKLGKLPQAWHHLSRYLAVKPEDAEAAGWLKEVDGQLRETHVLCHVSCKPADVRIFVQGESKEGYPCPLDWWFEPGRRLLRGEKDGFEQKLDVVEVVSGKGEQSVELVLLPAEKWGYIEVKGTGKSIQVFLDGMLEGKVPFRRKLKPGTYELMVGRPGELPWKKQVTVAAGETVVESPEIANPVEKPPEEDLATQLGTPVHVAAKAEPETGMGAWWKWTLVGAGVAAAATGGVFSYLATSRNDQLRKDYPDGTAEAPAPLQHRDLYNQAYDEEVQPKVISSYVLYGTGAAMALAGGILLMVGDASAKGSDKGEDRKLGLAPTLLPDGAALSFTLSW